MLTKIREVKGRFFFNERIDRYAIFLLGAIIIITLFLYFPYLTFSKLYVFVDAGTDTFSSYWPVYTYLIDWIREGNGLWSFNLGIGTSVLSLSQFLFDPFNIILLFSTKETLVYFIPYIVVLKMICSGFLFFYYLKYIGISSKAAFITSLMYTFNGYIVLWGQHYQFVLLFVFIPLVLWGYERLVRQNKFLMFTIAIGLTALYSYYFFYMFSIFIFIYAVTRYFAVEKFNFRKVSKLFLKVSGSYLLGVGLFMVLIAPSIYVALSNPRVSKDFTGMSLFSIASPIEYLTIAARLFSNDMMGMQFNFKGFFNYYEAPQLYCGLIVLILIPQIFRLPDQRKKIAYSIAGILWIAVLLFPFGSYFMNFFSAYRLRWTFIIIVYGLFLCANILDDVISTKRFSKPLFISTFLALVIVLAIISYRNLTMIDLNLNTKLDDALGFIFPASAVVCFLSFWFFYFLRYGNKQIGKHQLILLSIVLCLEIVALNYFSVNTARLTLSADYVESKQGYFDSSNDAVNYIKENDKSFYRIDKAYYSGFLNDPLFQDYRGTTSYNSLNHPSYIKFLQETTTMDFSNRNIIYGLNGRPYLESLHGVKYYIGLNETDCPIGFSFVKQFGNAYLFINNYVLPFGFTYNQYIDKKEYDKLQEYFADMTLLSAFVIENPSKIPDGYGNIIKLSEQNIPKSIYNRINYDVNNITYNNIEKVSGSLPERFEYKSTTNDPTINVPLTEKISGEVMKVKLKITSSTPGVGQIFWADQDCVFTEAKSNVFNLEQGEREYEIFIGNISSSVLRVDLGNVPDMNIIIENFEILHQAQDVIGYERIISKNSAQSLNISSFYDTCIEGNIDLKENKLMFFSIPYDKGWRVYVDKQQVSLSEVNMGFSGLFVEKGYHDIKLVYVAPWLNVGLIVSIVSVLIVLLILILTLVNKYRQRASVENLD